MNKICIMQFMDTMKSSFVYTHDQYLANVVPKPWYGLLGKYTKPRVRVKMGRAVV